MSAPPRGLSATITEVGAVAIDRFALGLHRAAFEHRDLLADLFEALFLARWQAAVAELVGADQRAVHQQVGITADWRGEVRIARERQPEMPEPLGRIACLHLGPEQLLHDLLTAFTVANPLDDAV